MTQDDRTPLSLHRAASPAGWNRYETTPSATNGELLMLSLVESREVQDGSGHDMRQDIEI